MGPEVISELPEREAYVNSLLDFHKKVESDLTKVLEKFKWNSKHFLAKESATATCKFCPDHRMPVESLQKHEDVCQWIQQGYTKEELENEVPSSEFFYEKSKIIPIKLDKEILNRILDEHHRQTKTVSPGDRNVPQTLVASKTDFTQAERLAIYEYVVRRSKEMNCMQSMPDDNLLTMDFEELIKKSAKSNVENVLCSEAEKWAAMRDYKRRRQSYRAKNVHITKKTYTEIIREVIHNQVDLLQEGLKSEPGSGEKSLAPPEDASPSASSSQKDRTDSERKAKRHSEDDQSRYKSRSYPRKKSRESPDRRLREGDKRSLKTSDPQHSEKYGRDRASPDLRKRDHKSLESHDRRDRGSPDRGKRARRSSPPSIRDKDRRSPDYRKRDKEYRKSRSEDPSEQWKKHSRNNLEGPSSEKRSKPEDETQLLLLAQPPPPPPPPSSVVSDEALLAKESQRTDCRFSHHKVLEEDQEVFGAKALPKTPHRRTSSSSDDEGSSVSHRHKKHSKSKKHKKHKHKSEKRRN